VCLFLFSNFSFPQAAYAEARLLPGAELLAAESFKEAVAAYGARVDRVEQRVVASLRAALSAARSASDMFAVFGQYSALFVRPRIRNAVAEYQDVLLGQVGDSCRLYLCRLIVFVQVRADIEELAGRLRAGYAGSAEARLDALHDTPPVAGAVVWARQLQRRLEELMRRLEDVLGPGWSANVDGKRLKQEGEALRERLDPEPLFKEWVEQTRQALETSSSGPDHQVAGLVFAVGRRGKEHVLGVAFDERLSVLFREVRNLGWLGFRVPFAITLLSSSVRQVYPHVVALRHQIRLYSACVARAEAAPQVRLLVAAAHRGCQTVLAGAMRLRWTALSKLPGLVTSLSAAVSAFSAALQQACDSAAAADEALAGLATCPYSAEALGRQLEAAQKQCDALELAGLSNLEAWTRELQQRVETALSQRLERALEAFAASLEAGAVLPGSEYPPLEECRFAIVLRNGSMVLEPPLAEARVALLAQLSSRMHTVMRLSPLRAGRYQIDAAASAAPAADLSSLLGRVPVAVLCRAYRLVEEKMRLAGAHVAQWLRYQGLWDMDHQTVYAKASAKGKNCSAFFLITYLSGWQRPDAVAAAVGRDQGEFLFFVSFSVLTCSGLAGAVRGDGGGGGARGGGAVAGAGGHGSGAGLGGQQVRLLASRPAGGVWGASGQGHGGAVRGDGQAAPGARGPQRRPRLGRGGSCPLLAVVSF
jgi:dynein heavy chain 1